jgi:hypothetical protein
VKADKKVLFMDTPGEYEAQRGETQETLITSKASL